MLRGGLVLNTVPMFKTSPPHGLYCQLARAPTTWSWMENLKAEWEQLVDCTLHYPLATGEDASRAPSYGDVPGKRSWKESAGQHKDQRVTSEANTGLLWRRTQTRPHASVLDGRMKISIIFAVLWIEKQLCLNTNKSTGKFVMGGWGWGADWTLAVRSLFISDHIHQESRCKIQVIWEFSRWKGEHRLLVFRKCSTLFLFTPARAGKYYDYMFSPGGQKKKKTHPPKERSHNNVLWLRWERYKLFRTHIAPLLG